MNSSSPKHRVALVVPALVTAGGVAGVARFFYRVLRDAGGYESSLISVPLASDDPASVRLKDPGTWSEGIKVVEGTWEDQSYRHVGALFSELEFQRYRPRMALTRVLNRHDLVQIVAGTPAWALMAKNVDVPVVLQTATLARAERKSLLAHTPGALGLWRRSMTQITNFLDHYALRYADRVLVENHWMHEHLANHMSEEHLVFAPPGIDTEKFSPGTVAPADGSHLLAVGRWADPRKNASLLVEAYARLRSQMDNPPPLVLVGRTGPPENVWKLAQALGIRSSITFRKDVSSAELVELYRTARCQVVSSDEEGLGLTILEAMSCGRPVVSTQCGGPSTAIDDNQTGRLTPVGQPGPLGDAIRDVLTTHGMANRMGQNGRARVENFFSLNASKKRILQVYETLLEAPV